MGYGELKLYDGIGARVAAPAIRDQIGLVEAGEDLLPAERATLLLAQCAQVGGDRGDAVAHALTCGDRVRLLLALRRLCTPTRC